MRRLVLLICTALALAACNTIAGVGEDIAAGARGVQSRL